MHWRWLLGYVAGRTRLLSMTEVGSMLKWQLGKAFLSNILLVY